MSSPFQPIATPDGIDPAFWNVFRNQLLIALVKKFGKGGRLVLTVDEVDATGDTILTLDADAANRKFTLIAGKKS